MSWLKRLLAGFADDTEPAPPYGDATRIVEVTAVLDEMRAMFRADGGDVALVGIEGGVVIVRLRGACASCEASAITVHKALEPRLKERLEWVESVRRG